MNADNGGVIHLAKLTMATTTMMKEMTQVTMNPAISYIEYHFVLRPHYFLVDIVLDKQYRFGSGGANSNGLGRLPAR